MNVNGLQETFGENEIQWFEKIREACGGESEIADYPNHEALKQDKKEALLNFLLRSAGFPFPPTVPLINYMTPIPMSEQMSLYLYNDVREYNLPYFKKGYGSEKLDLSSNGYASWIADRVDLIGNFKNCTASPSSKIIVNLMLYHSSEIRVLCLMKIPAKCFKICHTLYI